MIQLTAKTLKEEKERLFKKQNGICLLCKNDLNENVQSNHLDHDHALEGKNAGRVRGLLCHYCNTTEGVVKHKFERSGLKSKVDYITWLETLLNYLKQDYSEQNIHPQFILDTAKKFSRLSLEEMRSEMKSKGFEFEQSDKKATLVKKYRANFRKQQSKLGK